MSVITVLTVGMFLIVAVVLFSLAVFVHEAGHFLVARWLGLRADVFSIGFGPALWKKQVGATEYRFSAVPFGGYVSLPQLDPEGMKQIQGGGETLPPAAPWKRILVAVAGPFGNIVLAAVCALLIACFAPKTVTGSSTVVGFVMADSSAAQAGMLAGDEIVAVNGTPVRTWQDYMTECYLAGKPNEAVTLQVRRGEALLTLTPVMDTRVKDELYKVGGILPEPVQIVAVEVVADSPAARAGLQAGDILYAMNGEPMQTIEALIQRPNPAEPVTLTVGSAGQLGMREVTLVPELLAVEGEEAPLPRLGIALNYGAQQSFQWMSERSVQGQLWADASSIFRVLKALTAPKAEGETARAAKGLGGPLMLFSLFYQVVQAGLWVSLGFVRLICVNLAILNLLPIPVLDGGHILFALYALIRRKEAPAKVVAWVSNVFAFVLIGLMLLMAYRDVLRFF